MIEITHYIEDLLLHNDCVIVPGLGGFVAQDCSAYYVAEEEVFLPPYRSVSFNPRLTMNDGLLIHEVAQRSGITYEEASLALQQEVENIRRTIENEGQYTFHGIGVLQLSEGSSYDFIPILCGIAAPSLYGLDCFYATSFEEEEEELTEIEMPEQKAMQSQGKKGRTASLPIRLTLIHYAAVAIIAAVFFVLCLLPIRQPARAALQEAGIFQSVATLFSPQQQEATAKAEQAPPAPKATETICRTEEKAPVADTLQASQPVLQDKAEEAKNEQLTSAKTKDSASKSADEKAEKSKKKKSTAAAKKKDNVGPYTIVLSSAVPSNGARVMVRDMKRNGYSDARVFNDKRMVRVIYGNFSSQNAAKAALRNIRRPDNVFAQAWVYKIAEF